MACQREPRRFDRMQQPGQNECIDILGYGGLEPAIEGAERVTDPDYAGERVTAYLPLRSLSTSWRSASVPFGSVTKVLSG